MNKYTGRVLAYIAIIGLIAFIIQRPPLGIILVEGQDSGSMDAYTTYSCHDENMTIQLLVKLRQSEWVEPLENITLKIIINGEEVSLECSLLEERFLVKTYSEETKTTTTPTIAVEAVTTEEKAAPKPTPVEPTTTPVKPPREYDTITQSRTTQTTETRLVTTTKEQPEGLRENIESPTQPSEVIATTAKDLFERGVITLLGGVIAALIAMIAWRLLMS